MPNRAVAARQLRDITNINVNKVNKVNNITIIKVNGWNELFAKKFFVSVID